MTAAQGKRRATPKVPGAVSQDPPAATSAEAAQPAGQIVKHGDEGAPAIAPVMFPFDQSARLEQAQPAQRGGGRNMRADARPGTNAREGLAGASTCLSLLQKFQRIY